MVFHFLIVQFYLKNRQKKKRKWHISDKKKEERQTNATTLISVDGKGTVFPMKFKLQAESFEKTY